MLSSFQKKTLKTQRC